MRWSRRDDGAQTYVREFRPRPTYVDVPYGHDRGARPAAADVRFDLKLGRQRISPGPSRSDPTEKVYLKTLRAAHVTCWIGDLPCELSATLRARLRHTRRLEGMKPSCPALSRASTSSLLPVMPGLGPGIHVFLLLRWASRGWPGLIPGSSPRDGHDGALSGRRGRERQAGTSSAVMPGLEPGIHAAPPPSCPALGRASTSSPVASNSWMARTDPGSSPGTAMTAGARP